MSGERPIRAAIRIHPRGEPRRIFEGATHAEAYGVGEAAGADGDYIADFGLYGFVTDRGRFVTRRQAAKLSGRDPDVFFAAEYLPNLLTLENA